jgi:hypothetical protein
LTTTKTAKPELCGGRREEEEEEEEGVGRGDRQGFV